MKQLKKPSPVTQQTVSLFLFHANRYKKLFYPLIIAVTLTVLIMQFLQPYILSLVLQKISQKQYDASDLWGSFGPYIITYAVATVVSGIIGWRLNIWLLWQLELKVVKDIATRTFNHLMDLSANFHNNRFAGSLVSQSTKLTGAYVRFIDSSIFNLLELVVAMTATIVILAPRVPLYALTLIILSIIFIIGTVYFSRPVREANRLESEAQSRQTGYLADSISNLMVVKSFAARSQEKQRYAEVAEQTRQAGLLSMKRTTLRETYSSTITSAIGISAVIIAVLGAGKFKSDIATLFLIVSYTGAVGQKLWEFQNVLRQYNRAFGDASDMVKILAIEPEIKDPEEPEKLRIARGSIDFKDITFTHHENSKPLFEGLNLHVKAGEKIGLVGHSGSGKTSLSKLLLRFSDIDSGSIMIDGQDIRNITQDDLHRSIAYVPQEPLLFHRSLAENIAYGRPDAPQEEIVAIAKLANAHEFIAKLPEGYGTLVGERGVKLSGGQRQRVAIARAMLKNAPILVLDEATSALDSESEALIQDALWKLMQGRTAIVIAHRLSTIQKMDRIIVLDNGRVVEQGSHKQLIKHGGTYAKLWSHQSGGFIEE
ncbi:MAG TPA: ABC transporter ATP-binding protein [Candidatus Saccharimonadales bacterium]|nr:ABC transporter ATP-binding protein [Candidatus Saccharimonadales bacterium]